MGSKTVVIFGSTGAIGTNLVNILSKEQAKWEIKAVSRSGTESNSRLISMDLPSNVEIVKGSVENLEDCKVLTKDADYVACCVGFAQYERKYWAEHWPIVVRNLLEVTSNDRPLIFCDNLYAYGPKTSITTSTQPVEANLTSKPGVRAALRKQFEKRMAEQPESIAVVGGADFFGPHVTDKSFLGDTFVGNMVEGKKPLAIGSSTAIHDFCTAHDFANALYVAMANPKKSLGKFWICPHSIHSHSMEDIAEKVNSHLDKPVKGIQVLPVWMVSALGWFMGFMAEMKEMAPFWANDYSIAGDADFCKEFGVQATPVDDALKELVDYYKSKRENRN